MSIFSAEYLDYITRAKVYSRCSYYVEMYGDAECRNLCRTSRSVVAHFIRSACKMMKCEPLGVAIGVGCVKLLVELSPEISFDDFIRRLRLFTATWIIAQSDANVSPEGYWNDKYLVVAVSPEEKGVVFAGMQIQSAAEAPREATHWAHDVQIISADASSTHLYHIIVITYEGNMILPQKYAHELHAAANETCIALGAVTAKSVSSRNHVHILCRMPSTITLGKFLDKMRAELCVRLHSNSHFRKFRGWYRCDVIYTVSPCRIDFEEYNFGHQPELHSRRACANEMSAIYQRLQIPYVVSLN